MEKIPTGSVIFDELLGGYEIGAITTIFGPAGSGKTNACILAAIRTAGRKKKTVYIDTESRFSVERLQQITEYAHKVLPSVLLFTPKTFGEQSAVIAQLKNIRGIGLLVVDSISGLHRLDKSKQMHDSLKRHIAQLASCARRHQLPVLVTAQVYTDIETGTTKMVAERMIKNASSCLVELQIVGAQRRASSEGQHRDFCITEKGYLSVKSSIGTPSSSAEAILPRSFK